MSKTKQVPGSFHAWQDKHGVWHREELEDQPIRELPPRRAATTPSRRPGKRGTRKKDK